MDKVLLAIATLLWPLIVILVVFFFRPAVADIIESARSRKFALKIGGQELTMEGAGHGQQRLILDLLMQVAAIQKKVKISDPHNHGDTTGSSAFPLTRGASVLWVDDNPKNISYLLETLRDLGMKVDEATSTTDGMELFSSRLYDFVISDMRRQEGRNFNQTAGLELLKRVREKSPKVPFILFTGDGSIKECGSEVKRLGADMTSSPTRLLGILNAETLKSPRQSALGK